MVKYEEKVKCFMFDYINIKEIWTLNLYIRINSNI